MKRELKGKSLLKFPSDYVLLDIETTGFDSQYDNLLEVGAVKVQNNQIIDQFQSFVQCDYISSFISELTGITTDMTKNAPSLEVVLKDLVEFLGDKIIVGYNIHFDVNFLYDKLLMSNLMPIKNDLVDVMRLSKNLITDVENYKLSTVSKYFDIYKKQNHRAIDDCILTNDVLTILKEQFKEIIPKKKKKKKRSVNKNPVINNILDDGFDISEIEVDEDCLLYGKICCFTGKLEKMTRAQAQKMVENIGGSISTNVTNKTNFLILGNNDYCKSIKDGKSSKQKRAEKLKLDGKDIETISESVFYDLFDL